MKSIPKYPTDIGLSQFPAYRTGQREAIENIYNEFLRKKKIVVWEAPTGAGKSLVAVSVAALLDTSSIFTTTTKMLSDQYESSFDFMCQMRGRGNYACGIDDTLFATEGPCIAGMECIDKAKLCPYYLAKETAKSSPCVITNLPYFLNEVNYVGDFSGRGLLVIDEGHLLESGLMNFVSIELSRQRLARFGINLPIMQSVGDVLRFCNSTAPILKETLLALNFNDDPKKFHALLSLWQKLNSADNIVDNPDDWILSTNIYGYTIKPVWVSSFGYDNVFKHADKVLIMSATVRDPSRFARSLGIKHNDMAYVETQSYFDRSRCPINYWPVAKLSYNASWGEYQNLVDSIDAILDKHSGQKGIVHCVSFALERKILASTRHRKRFVSHDGKNREEVFNAFKESSGDAVLISPSAVEGIDLPDDYGRFCIIAKVPYPNLGDAQIKRRCDEDSGWYSCVTACSIVQATGRTFRSDTDWSTVYILDENIDRFFSKNGWLLPSWWKNSVTKIRSLNLAVDPIV